MRATLRQLSSGERLAALAALTAPRAAVVGFVPAGHRTSRIPTWSGRLTDPIAHVIPVGWQPIALNVIKGLHTAAFFSVGGAIVLFAWDGLRGRPRRRTAVALGVALAESAIYASNNQVCPLTPVAEELGARRGSVADIFLPDWFSQRIPLFGGSALLLGLVLNVRALLRLLDR